MLDARHAVTHALQSTRREAVKGEVERVRSTARLQASTNPADTRPGASLQFAASRTAAVSTDCTLLVPRTV